MTTNANKKQEQEARETAWREEIEKANATMLAAAFALKTRFEQPLIVNARCPEALARKLSERFKHFRFTVSYVDGEQSVYAEPRHEPFELAGYLEHAAKQATEAAAAVETRWAPFDTLRGYAQGYDQGLGDRRELEEKIRQLKEDGGGHRGYFHPAMMMFSPWGR